MGTAGYSIFRDDTALDVRDTWIEAARKTQSGEKAKSKVLQACKSELKDDDEGPVVWIALAMVAHKHGWLDADLKRRALRVIEEGQGLERWSEAGVKALAKRKAAYAKAKLLLESEQPERRLPAPERARGECPYVEGDVFRLPLEDGRIGYGKVLAASDGFHVVGLLDFAGEDESAVPPEGWECVPLRWFMTRREAGDSAGKIAGERAQLVTFWSQRSVPRKLMVVVANCKVSAAEQKAGETVQGTGAWSDLAWRASEAWKHSQPDFAVGRFSWQGVSFSSEPVAPGARPTDF